ncbi:MAG TPA: hypothetical protein VGC97_18155 [Pyrinomonadaceae bacterium]|jgi:hypothetical protein
MEENKQPENKEEQGGRSAGSIISMAIGAALGLAVMKAIGLGGAIPGGLFALLGAGAGELLYKMIAKK